jgi:hypothetical protein
MIEVLVQFRLLAGVPGEIRTEHLKKTSLEILPHDIGVRSEEFGSNKQRLYENGPLGPEVILC